MDYPIEKSFILRHVATAWNRFRMLLLLGGVLGGIFAGWIAFTAVPATYRLNGIVLLRHLSGNISVLQENAAALENLLNSEFAHFVKSTDCQNEGIVFHISSQLVDDNVVLSWSVECGSIAVAGRFLQYQTGFAPILKQKFPEFNSGFSIDKRPVASRDFRKSVLFVAIASGGGFLLVILTGLIIGGIMTGSDHSIGELGAFEEKSYLDILGVLPHVGPRKNIAREQLADDPYFRQAVNSLLLDVMFYKRSADRALVLMTSSLTSRNGASAVSLHLTQALKEYGHRVLLVNKENFDMNSLHLSGRMENFLAEQTGLWDFIIIDVPDSRNSNIPMIVGKLADIMLLVCDCRKSPEYLLQVVLWRFRKAGVKVAGCVINHFPMNKRRADYDFYQRSFYHYGQR